MIVSCVSGICPFLGLITEWALYIDPSVIYQGYPVSLDFAYFLGWITEWALGYMSYIDVGVIYQGYM